MELSLSSSSSAAVEVPHYFLCPISLEVMRDPVTLATGITYDRASIERWLFSDGHATCPVTRSALAPHEREATPNHTLRRLIQAWCAAHQVERFPTPRPPLDSCRVAALLDEGRHGGKGNEVAALREIKAIVAESDRNRRCVKATPGAVEFLVSVVTKHSSTSRSTSKSSKHADQDADEFLEEPDSPTSTSSQEEDALSVLYSLKPSEKSLAQILEKDGDFLDTLASVLRRPSYRSRTYGILLLKALTAVMEPARLTTVSAKLVQEVVRVVVDRVSSKAVRAALHVLCRLCPWGRNRVKAVEAGAVAALVELLLDEGGRRVTELAVIVVDHLCGCAEGRSELVAHPAGLAVVSKKAMRVSLAATESAVRALHAVARHSPTPAVLQEMLAVGVVAKLLLVLQVDAGERARVRAKEMLKAHTRVWKDSPCLPAHLKASYPC
ncbi:E3 ubiquitin-protein ligase PUB23-like [Phragmites australis]|uniref:E3 ubiquitin-protein ligase PUB23-like n=1 Tax=Phragmites australis TaxID=29695 RepID=UPI002D7940DA|nr:E3 ubiquitin-protein ligase PUB23-like [Phragmites australis]